MSINKSDLDAMQSRTETISKIIFSNLLDSCEDKIFYQPIFNKVYMSNVDTPVLKSSFSICIKGKNKYHTAIVCSMESELLDRQKNRGITVIDFSFPDLTKESIQIRKEEFNRFLELWEEKKRYIATQLNPLIKERYGLINNIAPKTDININITSKKTIALKVKKNNVKLPPKIKIIMCS